MRRSGWSFVALLALAAASADPARATVEVSPGQEFLYAGAAHWQISGNNGHTLTIKGSVKLTALVTEADPTRGYKVILLRLFQPETQAGRVNFPVGVGVASVRYGADLTLIAQSVGPTGPMSAVLQIPRVPLAPRRELTAGQQWHQREALPLLLPPLPEIIYSVTGEKKVGQRACLTIEKKLVQPLPLQQDRGGSILELADYGETLCVDPLTGQVVSDKMHETARVIAGGRRSTLDLVVAVTLRGTRRLPAAELASRVKQAEVLDHVQWALFPARPDADRSRTLSQVTEELAAFRRDYSGSPYTPALTRLDEMLGRMRAEAERSARPPTLVGAPAPAFALQDLAGRKQSPMAYRGQVILLHFFASWCPPCNAEAPHLEKVFWQQYRRRGLVVLGVDFAEQNEPARRARRFRDMHGLTYPILVDAGDRVAQRYGATGTPTNVVIDHQGVVRLIEVGFDPLRLQKTIDNLLSPR